MSNTERTREQELTAPGPQPADERRMAGWVGKALLIQGRVVSTEDLTIDGRVEGTIELGDRSLTIGVGASVNADLTAQTILISGAVVGNVRASVRVEIQPTGSVIGNVTAPRLALIEGAFVTGRVDAAGATRPGRP